MQKVEGSSPFSRFPKGPLLRAFVFQSDVGVRAQNATSSAIESTDATISSTGRMRPGTPSSAQQERVHELERLTEAVLAPALVVGVLALVRGAAADVTGRGVEVVDELAADLAGLEAHLRAERRTRG